jgi:hypothetical protein
VILTVDDDAAVSRAIARDLRRRYGDEYRVVRAESGCVECDAGGGWWVHLRRCTLCGHIGCCDDSPAKRATAHAKATGHR